MSVDFVFICYVDSIQISRVRKWPKPHPFKFLIKHLRVGIRYLAIQVWTKITEKFPTWITNRPPTAISGIRIIQVRTKKPE